MRPGMLLAGGEEDVVAKEDVGDEEDEVDEEE